MDTDNTEGAPVLHVANASRIRRMLWIGFYTFALNILTLTLFRFWGRTHFRRQLWSDTTIGDDALEYTGRGIELFIGFLIATFTIMIPTVVLLLLAQLLLGETGALIAIFILYFGLFWLMGVAVFLVRRYLISRTRYRGVRFEQRGSAITYGWRAFGYLFATALTLGWLSPFVRLRLSKYMWDNAYFGSEKIHFEETEEAKSEPVYKSFAVMWVGGIVLYTLFVTIMFNAMSAVELATGHIGVVLKFYGAGLVLGVLFALFAAWYQAVMTRKIVKSLSIAGVKASCDLTAIQLLRVWFLGVLLSIVTLGIGSLAFNMMIWRLIANHIRFDGEIDFEAIEQAASTGPSQGEGIADGLDIGSAF
ncbi:MAG: DUF898 family protein [Pseudomonadota bacterium]